MEFDVEIQHRPGRKHMAARVLSRLPTTQSGEYKSDDDIPKYEEDEVHAVNENKSNRNVEPRTIQSFVYAQIEHAQCRYIVDKADAAGSHCCCEEFDMLRRRA